MSRLNYSNNNGNNIIDNCQNFNPKLMKIKIVKGRIRKDKTGKPYLEYMIELIYLDKKWTINKRFSQFTSLYKNLKKMEIQEGIDIPKSANIFSNIGTVFSGLSHENKILNLEKFLEDISMNEEINNTSLYNNFFETENISSDVRMFIKNNKRNNNTSNNIIYYKKLSNESLNYQNNEASNKSFSTNIENKLEKMVQEIKASKGMRKIPHNYKDFNISNFEPKNMNNKTYDSFKYSNNKINI